MGNIIKERLTEPVETKYGKIVGRKIIPDGSRPVDAFQGVPYAKPPLRELRFKKPEPPEPWKDIRKTIAFKARPIQKDDSVIDTLKLPCQSEDCLQLNIFCPAWPTDKEELFPVMVFIHGGGFVFDSVVKYGDIGICSHLVAQCETVVISVEYRLGFLGFFSTGDDACEDNLGLWDMVMALEWIRDNIRAFRGDPNNVTLFGQSAGGCAVDLLSLSPKTKGLFHRIIPMSGNANCTWALTEDGVEKSRKFVSGLGVKTADTHQMISKLRTIEASKFAVGFSDIEASLEEGPIAPRLGNSLLPKSLPELVDEAPRWKRLIGGCQHEGIMYADGELTLDMVQENIARLIPETGYPNFVELRKKALDLYIKPADYDNKSAVILAWVNCISDSFMNVAVQKNVLEQLRVGNKEVYLYSFDYCNPESMFPNKPIKATHCLDLNYLLYIFMFTKYKFNETDWRVLRILTKLWSNFAKYDNPNGSESVPDSRPEGDFVWLPVTAEYPQRHLSIGPNPVMRDVFQDGRPMFWIDLEKQRRS